MKVFYRKAPGCFICTDRYVRPWWQTFFFYLRPRPHLGAFFASFFLSLASALIFPALFR